MAEKFFLDTSALIKRYKQEEGSDRVNQLFATKKRLFISTVTLVEVISNLRRLVDVPGNIDFTETDFLHARATFLADIADGFLQTVEVTTTMILIGFDLISTRYMKPIDALQLATALSLSGDELIFVSADQYLNKRAREEGLSVLDPNQ